jgi:hypothetical protein
LALPKQPCSERSIGKVPNTMNQLALWLLQYLALPLTTGAVFMHEIRFL